MILLVFYLIIILVLIISIFNIKLIFKKSIYLFIGVFSCLFVIINVYFIVTSYNEAINILNLQDEGIFNKFIGSLEYEIFWVFLYHWTEILLLPFLISVTLTFLIKYLKKKRQPKFQKY